MIFIFTTRGEQPVKHLRERAGETRVVMGAALQLWGDGSGCSVEDGSVEGDGACGSLGDSSLGDSGGRRGGRGRLGRRSRQQAEVEG